VIFRDGSTEAHVPANRIAIPASRLHGQNSNLYTPVASGKYSKSNSTNNLSGDIRLYSKESEVSPTERLIYQQKSLLQKEMNEKEFEDLQNALLVEEAAEEAVSMDKFNNKDLLSSNESYIIGSNEILEDWTESGTPNPSSSFFHNYPPHSSSDNRYLFAEKSNDSNDSSMGSSSQGVMVLNQRHRNSLGLGPPSENGGGEEEVNSPQKISNLSKLCEVVFPSAPLGIFLSANGHGEPEITKVKVGGNAAKFNLGIGDIITHINQIPVKTYEEAMNLIPKTTFPMVLTIRKNFTQPIILTPAVENNSPMITLKKSHTYSDMYSADVSVFTYFFSFAFSFLGF
jgi:hypothetical protein